MIEKLQERLKDLETQKKTAQAILSKAAADLMAIDGAMQEVSYWIKKLEGEDAIKGEEAKSDN